jgi:hypothetical protein
MKTLPQFEIDRREQAQCASDISSQFAQGHKVVAVVAPVKSGKSEIKIIFRLQNASKKEAHLYISSLNRVDEKDQIKRLQDYDIDTYITCKKSDVDAVIERVRTLSKKKDAIYLHFNESDYGTESRQSLGSRFGELLQFPKVRLICYSATNEELRCSGIPHTTVEYVPNNDYRGAEYFLSVGLVNEATSFWDWSVKKLSDQATINIKQLVANDEKIFGVVRFAGHNELELIRGSVLFAQQVAALGITEVRFITGLLPFDWSRDHRPYVNKRDDEDLNPKVLLILNQTCTRSTEVKFHEYIDFWHDFRSEVIAYNTAIQAFGRPFHYRSDADPAYNIRVFAKVSTFELAAGRKSKGQYSGKLSERVGNNYATMHRADLQLLAFDHEPTRAEIDAYFAVYGAKSKGGHTLNLHVSANKVNDMAAQWFGGTSRPHNHRSDQDNVLHVDAAHPDHQDSWDKYVVRYGLQGKFVLMIPVIKQMPIVVHSTANKSMFQKYFSPADNDIHRTGSVTLTFV